MPAQDPFQDIQYKKNYLRQVIVKFDFPHISEIGKKLPPNIGDEAKKTFPISEPRSLIGKEFQISLHESVKEKESKLIEWNFHDKDRSKTLKISPTSLLITYTQYNKFEELRSDFISIIETFFQAFKEVQGTRLGLRYINEIMPEHGDVLAWTDYLNETMLCLFGFAKEEDRGALSRVFHNMEYNFGDLNLRYQFGMHNADYPAPIRKKSFILDLDAYGSGPLDERDIGESLERFHLKIQELFEFSIKDRLRESMNA